METQNTYTYSTFIDEQRLKEVFFSAPKEPIVITKTPPKKIPQLFTLLVFTGLLIITLLTLNYELIFLPRQNITPKEKNISLIQNKAFAQIKHIGNNTNAKIGNYALYLTSYPQKKSGIKINFNTPIDLTKKTVLLYLKNPQVSIKIAVIAKDNRYFSNALSPVVAVTDPSNKENILKVALNFEALTENKLSLAHVNQLTLYFYPQINEKQMGILIQDIVLADNTLSY